MRHIVMTNPTDIVGVEEYTEGFWVPSIGEQRALSVWREANGTYAYVYEHNQIEHYQTGFTTAQVAYEHGRAVVAVATPDAEAI